AHRADRPDDRLECWGEPAIPPFPATESGTEYRRQYPPQRGLARSRYQLSASRRSMRLARRWAIGFRCVARVPSWRPSRWFSEANERLDEPRTGTQTSGGSDWNPRFRYRRKVVASRSRGAESFRRFRS